MRVYINLILFVSLATSGQEKFNKDSIQIFQYEMNSHFSDTLKSPLLAKDIKNFQGLDFYEINEKYFVLAKFIRSKKEKPFEMKTTTDRKPLYIKYGEVHFILDGKNCQLNVYQNVIFGKKPGNTTLFLPFTDETSGIESYGGGRYIDLEIPTEKRMVIDFNKAYNPYCAYNPAYSCPIVPTENHLEIEILAGVKKFHD